MVRHRLYWSVADTVAGVFLVHSHDHNMYIASFIQMFVTMSSWETSWYSIVCAAFQLRGTPCVLTVQTHTSSPQLLSRHSGFYSYSITATTATTNVNLLGGIHRTQWGIKYRNTTSTQYFLIPTSSSPPISTTWHGDPFYCWWWTVAAISVWGTEILQGHANRHLAYPPQADVDRLIKHLPPALYQYSTSHLQSPEESPLWHNTLMRAGVRCVVVEATPPSSWDVPAITQPQGATEEFFQTHSARPGNRWHHILGQ